MRLCVPGTSRVERRCNNAAFSSLSPSSATCRRSALSWAGFALSESRWDVSSCADLAAELKEGLLELFDLVLVVLRCSLLLFRR